MVGYTVSVTYSEFIIVALVGAAGVIAVRVISKKHIAAQQHNATTPLSETSEDKQKVTVAYHDVLLTDHIQYMVSEKDTSSKAVRKLEMLLKEVSNPLPQVSQKTSLLPHSSILKKKGYTWFDDVLGVRTDEDTTYFMLHE